jgi:hypothetical protein
MICDQRWHLSSIRQHRFRKEQVSEQQADTITFSIASLAILGIVADKERCYVFFKKNSRDVMVFAARLLTERANPAIPGFEYAGWRLCTQRVQDDRHPSSPNPALASFLHLEICRAETERFYGHQLGILVWWTRNYQWNRKCR